MPLTSDITRYRDVQSVLDRALREPQGIKIDFPSSTDAVTWRAKAYHVRRLARREADSLTTAYDDLEIIKVGNALHIRRPVAPPLRIQAL